MIMIVEFIFNISNLSIIVCFLTKPLILWILFSTVVNAVFVARPLISGILPSILVILVLYQSF